MYWSDGNGELSRDKLDAARLGFKQFLRCKRFSHQFIERHGDDLFATASLEYSRKLAEGEKIQDPAGWLVHCAWQRTKSQLEAEDRRPHVVSTEKSGPVDELGPGPEDVVLDEDRFRKVHEAVKELSVNQRRVLALSYFEGLTVREAGRRLQWHSSKAQRAHEGAKRRLHELLGVNSSDDLQVEIGLAAYLSVAAESANGNVGVVERGAQKAAEGLTLLKQQLAEGGAQLKQHAVTTYYRAVDPTPLAAARPGTVASVVAGCIAFGSGAAYCVEQSVNPIGAARSLIASAPQQEAQPSPEPPDPPSAPVYTPVEPPAESKEPPAPEPPAPVAEEPRKPKPEPPPPDDSYEPVRPAYMASSESETAYEAPEPAAAETPEPAPVPPNAGPQFGGP